MNWIMVNIVDGGPEVPLGPNLPVETSVPNLSSSFFVFEIPLIGGATVELSEGATQRPYADSCQQNMIMIG